MFNPMGAAWLLIMDIGFSFKYWLYEVISINLYPFLIRKKYVDIVTSQGYKSCLDQIIQTQLYFVSIT